MAHATKTSIYRRAFIIDADRLSRLHDLPSTYVDDLHYRMESSDGISRQVNLEELLDADNAAETQICEVYVSGGSYGERHVSLWFINRRTLPIAVNLSGPEPEVVDLDRRLTRLLAGTRPWYDWFSTVNVLPFALALVLAALLIGLFFILTAIAQGLHGARESALSANLTTATLAMIVCLVPTVALLLLAAFQKRLFPVGTFAIGQGKQRHEFGEKLRWVVIIGFVVSAAASLLVGLLLAAFLG
jgi:hypothetical protein